VNSLQVSEALAGIISAMRADSYEISVVDVRPDRLALAISADEGACEDCLSPPAVMAQVISGALAGRYTPEQIDIAYPVA